MKTTLWLAVVIGLACSVAVVDANIRHYYMDRDHNVVKQSEDTRGGVDIAIVCNSSDDCFQFSCNWCHKKVDRAGFTDDSIRKHKNTYFPKSAVRLRGSQQASFGDLIVKREGGALMLRHADGRRHRLPPDAVLLRSPDGRKAMIVYGGTRVPALTK